MKKIIVSAAVAALALTTTASALEDIKVNGQAKIWYETNDKDNAADKGLFAKETSSGEVVFKLGMTGKQGNVGFGATVYQNSTMGLEGNLVSSTRTATTNLGGAAVAGGPTTTSNTSGGMWTGEAYVTAPVMGATLKLGKQELDTPLAFTERWNAAPNSFNAAVGIIPASDNLTVVAAYVGQGNADSWAVNGEVVDAYNSNVDAPWNNATFALAALFKADAVGVNVWAYGLASLANAVWVDASVKAGPATVKAYLATIMPGGETADSAGYTEDSLAYALSASADVAGWNISGAFSMVDEDSQIPVANTATGFKKTKLPTAGVYTDGVYVAHPGSTAIKVKAAGKVGSTGLALQAINNTNDNVASKETTEIDLIITQKLGDFDIKGILMNRSFADSATDASTGANHVRLITSINF